MLESVVFSGFNVTQSTLVIGAGIAGLSAAHALLAHGHAVTMLERGAVGQESSWAGAGILSPLLPWDYPAPLYRMTLRAMAQYPVWVAALEAVTSLKTEYWRCGMHIYGLSDTEPAQVWCHTHGLVVRQQEGQITLPDIAQVRNPRLIAALREAVVRLGGEIHTHSAAESISSQAGRMVAAHTAHATFTADRFVLATGAWSGLDLPGLPAVPAIRPIRGQMLLFKLTPGVLNTILYRQGLYLIPRRDGHILVGSTLEDTGFDKSTDDATRQRLHAEAAELLPALATHQPVQHWAGLRPGSPDNIPVIDRHPDFDNVFVNTGHFRYGVTMAPASAELLVDLMEGRTPALDPTPYSWAAAQARRWAPLP